MGLIKEPGSYSLGTFAYPNRPTSEFLLAAQRASLPITTFPQSNKFDLRPIWTIAKYIRRNSIDILQTHGYKGHFIAAVLRPFLRFKWLAMTHGWTAQDFKVQVYQTLERQLLKGADIAATVSPALHAELCRLRGNNKRSELIYNTVEIPAAVDPLELSELRQNYGLTNDHFTVACIGRLSSEKGQIDLLTAWQKVIQAVPQARLLLIGDGPQEQEIVSFIRKNFLNDSVKICGYQTRMALFYALTDLVVMPSLSEGMPNVLLEAFANSRPCLATDVGAVNLLIKPDTGWLTQPGKPDLLADKIISIANLSASQRQVFGARAQASLHPDFDPAGRTQKFLRLYRDLIAGD